MKGCGLWLASEAMVELCREFAVSRKTGYKIFDRYKESGLEALTDRSRRPWRYANQLPQQVESAILPERRGHRGSRAQGSRLSAGQKPNDLWCTDYKGEFRLGEDRYRSRFALSSAP